MIGALLPVAGWCAGTVLMWRWPVLGRRPQPGDHGRVSIVIPARDEAARLPHLLASLPWGTHEVIVVDDDSSDATALRAEAAGARVIASGGPPPGWTGKAWACAQGARAATCDVLVFLDADTWLADPEAVNWLVGALPEGGLLSVQPFHITERLFEELSAPCNVVAAMSAPTVAFGPCLVTTRDALAAVGGFDAVAGEVVEDIALAAEYRRAGREVRCLGGGDAVRFRMYDSPRALVEGWTKNLAVGAGRASPARVAGSVLWVAGGLAAVASPVGYAAFAVQLGWMLRRLGRFRIWTWLLYPVPLVGFVALFATSVLKRARGTVRWRGRTIALR